jgi:hypothetical protein
VAQRLPILDGLTGAKALTIRELISLTFCRSTRHHRSPMTRLEPRALPAESKLTQIAKPGSNPMKYYSVAEIEITDQSWIPAYVENITRLVEQGGGRYLARTSKIEGQPKA